MKDANSPSIVTTLTERDYKALKAQAESMGLSVDEMADRAISEGIRQKFKSPSKGLCLKYFRRT